MLPVRESAIDRLWEDPFELMRQPFSWARMFNPLDEARSAGFPVDIREDENNYYVDADLPGFDRKQIDVTLRENVLTITANAEQPDTQQVEYLRRERPTGSLQRSFRLSAAVDDSKIEAKLDHGVLHLVLPKRAEVRPKKIELKE